MNSSSEVPKEPLTFQTAGMSQNRSRLLRYRVLAHRTFSAPDGLCRNHMQRLLAMRNGVDGDSAIKSGEAGIVFYGQNKQVNVRDARGREVFGMRHDFVIQ